MIIRGKGKPYKNNSVKLISNFVRDSNELLIPDSSRILKIDKIFALLVNLSQIFLTKYSRYSYFSNNF